MKGDYIYGYFYLHPGYYRSNGNSHEYYENYRLDRSSEKEMSLTKALLFVFKKVRDYTRVFYISYNEEH